MRTSSNKYTAFTALSICAWSHAASRAKDPLGFHQDPIKHWLHSSDEPAGLVLVGNLNPRPVKTQHSTTRDGHCQQGNLEKQFRAQAMSKAAREYAIPQARMAPTNAVKKPHFCLRYCLDTAWWNFAIEAVIIIKNCFWRTISLYCSTPSRDDPLLHHTAQWLVTLCNIA